MRKFFSLIKNLINKRNLKKVSVYFGFLIVFFGITLLISPALASSSSNSNQFFDAIIRACSSMAISLATLCIKLSIFALQYIIAVAGYNGYLDTPAVQVGWVMVRDVSNMFFVVVLLIIAFGTILGLEQYEWKKMMVKFVLAAILINFSRTICGAIIDAAQVFMTTFVNAVSATAGGNLMRMFKMDQILSFSRNSDAQDFTDTNVFLASAGALLFAAILLGVMVAYLIVLLMRMLVLWILIILSPLAFILSLLPQTQGQAQRWWKEFGNHVVVGPVVIFFIWLSFVAAGSGNLFDTDVNASGKTVAPMNTTLLSTEANAVGKPSSAGLSQIMEWSSMANFFIAVGMLMVGVRVANELGVEGGSALNKAVDYGKKIATVGTGVAAGMWMANKAKEGAKWTGKQALKGGLAVGDFALDVSGKYEQVGNFLKRQQESYRGWRANVGSTKTELVKNEKTGEMEYQLTKDKNGNAYYKRNNTSNSIEEMAATIRKNAKQNENGEWELEGESGKTIEELTEKLHKNSVERSDGGLEWGEKQMKFSDSRVGAFFQRRAHSRRSDLIASRKKLEKTKNFADNREELLDKRTKGVPTGLFILEGEQVDALDRVEQGELKAERARSAAKTEEYHAKGEYAVKSSPRFQEGKFKKGATLGQQEQAHLLKAERAKEAGAVLSQQQRKDFIEGKFGFGEAGHMVLEGKVRLEEEKKALGDEVSTLTEEGRRSVLLADKDLNRSVTAAATTKERAEAEVKNARGGVQREYEQDEKEGGGKNERQRIEAAKIRGARHQARMKEYEEEAGLAVTGEEGERGKEMMGAIAEKIEAEKRSKLAEETRKRIEAEEEYKFEESKEGGKISIATIEQEEKKKAEELKAHAHEEDERKKFFEKEKQQAEDSAVASLAGTKEEDDLKAAQTTLKEKNNKSGDEVKTAEEEHQKAVNARQAQLDKVKALEAKREDIVKHIGQPGYTNEDFDNVDKELNQENGVLGARTQEEKEAAKKLKDTKDQAGITLAEEEESKAQAAYDNKKQAYIAQNPTVLMTQQAAEYGQEAAKGFIDRLKKENISNIFTKAAQNLQEIFKNLKIEGKLNESEVMSRLQQQAHQPGGGVTAMASQAMYAQQLNDYYGDLSGIDKAKAVDAADDLVSMEKLGFTKQSTAFKQAMSKSNDNLQGVEREQGVSMLTKSIKDLFYRKFKGEQLDTMQQASLMSGLKFLIQNGWNDDLLASLVNTVRSDDENKDYKNQPGSEEAKKANVLKDILVNQLGIGKIDATSGRIQMVNRSGGDRTNGINRLIAMAGDSKLLMQENAVLKYQRAQKEQNGRDINYETALKEMVSKTSKLSDSDLEKHRAVRVDEATNDEAGRIGISAKDVREKEADNLGISKDFAGITYNELKSFKDAFSASGNEIDKAFDKFISQIDKYSSQFEAFAGLKDLGLNTTHLDDVGHMKFDMDTGFAHGQLADDAMNLVLSDWRKVNPRQRISKLKSHAIGKMSEDYNTLSHFHRDSFRETYNGANTELQFSDMDGRNINQIVKLAADEKERKDESGRFQALHAESVLVAKQFGGDMDAAIQDTARDWEVALEEGPIALMSCLSKKGGINWENMANGKVNISLPDLDDKGAAKKDANGKLVEAKKIDRIEDLVEWINKARSQYNNQGRKDVSVQTVQSALATAKRSNKDTAANIDDDQPAS